MPDPFYDFFKWFFIILLACGWLGMTLILLVGWWATRKETHEKEIEQYHKRKLSRSRSFY